MTGLARGSGDVVVMVVLLVSIWNQFDYKFYPISMILENNLTLVFKFCWEIYY